MKASLAGRLASWNDERGFGFIAPRDGGREIFVHISAFPRDGSRPTVGESLIYERGLGRDGQPSAVRVQRQAFGHSEGRRAHRRRVLTRRSRTTAVLAAVAIAAGLAAFGLHASRRIPDPAAIEATGRAATFSSPSPSAAWRCDGRTLCSQMTSCAEATFFLRNCPGTQLDGDNDGTPCERQWCSGASGW